MWKCKKCGSEDFIEKVFGGYDITVAFLEKDEGFESEDCHILLFRMLFAIKKKRLIFMKGVLFLKSLKLNFLS
ncbi:hypothetical protein C4N15_06935 [Fusobacterium necrophorum subsp. funduliforme]|uniref:hypothetical protein n=1 Tax=Fusobacterium necrophorum TaxID=859 RepID=UPI000D1335B3|nr:hypothetical protein [Fusobacterium necrophorum]AVQ21390.1 hypothetical protein C4N15_06935 [Fusobacterium necrophorum subsp. funduliforme]